MDIAEHLAEHEEVLRALAYRYGGSDQDLVEDCYQAGALVLMEAHAGPFRHEAELMTFAYRGVKGAMLAEAKRVKGEYRYGIKDELDDLQEWAEEQGRGTVHLDPLYESPIPGLRSPLEQSLSPEDEKLALRIREALTPDELRILEARMIYPESLAHAAASLGMPRSTYQDGLRTVKLKLAWLARVLS